MNAKVYELHVLRVQDSQFRELLADHIGLISIDMIEFQYTVCSTLNESSNCSGLKSSVRPGFRVHAY
jgi:hypothetical protein